MPIIHALPDFRSDAQTIALSIGNFDGVHRGHLAVLDALTQQEMHSVVLTFSNHPAEVISGAKIPLLTSLPHKLHLLQKAGVQTTLLLPFTSSFSLQSARTFLINLRKHIPFTHLILGHDAAFGHQRGGDPQTLLALAEQLDFTITYIPPDHEGDEVISSSQIRLLIQQGKLDQVARLLGRPFSIVGTVEHGAGHGKVIGFQTANLSVEGLCLPPMGVYVVDVSCAEQTYRGVANLGFAPTLHESRLPLLEAHLFDCQRDLYDEELEVTFRHFLRPERKFNSVEALKSQVQEDIKEALLNTA